MRKIFNDSGEEQFFNDNGYLVFDLLGEPAINQVLDFYKEAFSSSRDVVDFAKKLPYYISIFDADTAHKKATDQLITALVEPSISTRMNDYEVYYSNFMIKFPGDGQIEAHQDFNFVDESEFTACNLWCPMVDTNTENGGLWVIPGSHKIFKTQRGVNLPQSLTQYNELLKKFGLFIPLDRGQAIIFDHRLVHFSKPNRSGEARIALQSVLKPVSAAACHCYYHQATGTVQLRSFGKEFIFNNNLWSGALADGPVLKEEELIEFPSENEMISKLTALKVKGIRSASKRKLPTLFADSSLQQLFEINGFVKLNLLEESVTNELRELFMQHTGGNVQNSDYGMYISLEEDNLEVKKELANTISRHVYPSLQKYFIDCKPHLGSFLVKAPDPTGYSYPHQDWTFVDTPPHCSVTVWIALVDTDVSNGTLGFVRGSQWFFDYPVGSPSPEFRTCTQEHGALFYQYLDFIPLKAGEAIAFDNRTIHGASPNNTLLPRIAAAVGLTPRDAPLCHYYLAPMKEGQTSQHIAKLKVDENFFHSYSLKKLQQLYHARQLPAGYEVKEWIAFEPVRYSNREIEELCLQSELKKNGHSMLAIPGSPKTSIGNGNEHLPFAGKLKSIKKYLSKLLLNS